MRSVSARAGKRHFICQSRSLRIQSKLLYIDLIQFSVVTHFAYLIPSRNNENKVASEIKFGAIFHKNLGSFCRLYDFLTQIVSYDDTSLETRYLFYKHLDPLVRPERIKHGIDLSEVVLTNYKLKPTGGYERPIAIPLGLATAEGRKLKPLTEVGTQSAKDPGQVRLEELIERLNDLFADEALTDADMVGMFNHVAAKLLASENIQQQAIANTRQQFLQSPTFAAQGKAASIAAMDSYETMGKKLFANQEKMSQFLSMLAEHVYDEVHRTQPVQ